MYEKHPHPFFIWAFPSPTGAHHGDKCQGDDLIAKRFYFDLYRLQIANEGPLISIL